jgi:hypothetical protein
MGVGEVGYLPMPGGNSEEVMGMPEAGRDSEEVARMPAGGRDSFIAQPSEMDGHQFTVMTSPERFVASRYRLTMQLRQSQMWPKTQFTLQELQSRRTPDQEIAVVFVSCWQSCSTQAYRFSTKYLDCAYLVIVHNYDDTIREWFMFNLELAVYSQLQAPSNAFGNCFSIQSSELEPFRQRIELP